jgi:hypothetical protein
MEAVSKLGVWGFETASSCNPFYSAILAGLVFISAG